MAKATVSVFEYLDFRAYLADLYAQKKAEGTSFSYRAFSRRAGLKSPNHLKLVIDGERALSPSSAARYAQALRLDDDEASYFRDLVSFCQASSTAERIDAYQALSGHQLYRQSQRLDARFAAFYSQWYIPAIREMAMQEDFVGDPSWIAQRMVPAITIEQAEQGLDVLLELGLLTSMDDGSLAITEWVVHAPDETKGVHLALYHRAMLERAAECIDLVPATERHLSAVTLCLGPGGYERIVERLKRLRQELIGLACMEDEGEHVVHVGLQAFPLTRRIP